MAVPVHELHQWRRCHRAARSARTGGRSGEPASADDASVRAPDPARSCACNSPMGASSRSGPAGHPTGAADPLSGRGRTAPQQAPAPQAPMARAGVPAMPPPPPVYAPETVTIQVPPGTAPGAVFRIKLTDGRDLDVTVPAGVQPGCTLTIAVPPRPRRSGRTPDREKPERDGPTQRMSLLFDLLPPRHYLLQTRASPLLFCQRKH